MVSSQQQAKPVTSHGTSSQDYDVDIAIVGGGIVGLALAAALVNTTLKIALIDNQEKSVDFTAFEKSYDSRVSALTMASRDFFLSLGVWDRISDLRTCAYQDMFVWDADGTASIHFSAAEIHQQALGYITENRLVSTALIELLENHQQIQMLQPEMVSKIYAESDNNLSQVELKSGKSVSCKLIIGADGANSFIREQSGFNVNAWDYQHQGIVTTVKTEKSHQFTAWQRFMPTGPLAFLPLANLGTETDEDSNSGHYCSIVWSCVPSLGEELLAMNDSQFSLALAEAFEYKLGNIEQVEQRFAFPLWQRHAKDYVKKGIALIGDAAHTIHPLAGQGVNLGLLDVASLTEVIKKALESGEDFASLQVLSRYQRQRKANNLGMMLAMEGFKRLFASDDLSLRWLRNFGLSQVNSMSSVKHRLMTKAMGL